MSDRTEKRLSWDIFQNGPPPARWTGVAKEHPAGGGSGVEVFRKSGYVSEAAAEKGLQSFTDRWGKS
jgi:hypothetical protein